ncbi:MAG: hypothetical protein KAT77_03545 [Nanoarchaeota archaeon]|nr:hypothetical protein [Nanoarchaeota archaeon]
MEDLTVMVVDGGENILVAKRLAYAAMGHVFIDGNNLRYRTDIGSRDVGRALRGK